jgi:hypothetical protein
MRRCKQFKLFSFKFLGRLIALDVFFDIYITALPFLPPPFVVSRSRSNRPKTELDKRWQPQIPPSNGRRRDRRCDPTPSGARNRLGPTRHIRRPPPAIGSSRRTGARCEEIERNQGNLCIRLQKCISKILFYPDNSNETGLIPIRDISNISETNYVLTYPCIKS